MNTRIVLPSFETEGQNILFEPGSGQVPVGLPKDERIKLVFMKKQLDQTPYTSERGLGVVKIRLIKNVGGFNPFKKLFSHTTLPDGTSTKLHIPGNSYGYDENGVLTYGAKPNLPSTVMVAQSSPREGIALDGAVYLPPCRAYNDDLLPAAVVPLRPRGMVDVDLYTDVERSDGAARVAATANDIAQVLSASWNKLPNPEYWQFDSATNGWHVRT